MHCPYCQAINQERAIYCARCGRDMRQPLPPQSGQPYQPPGQTPSSYQPPRQAPPTAARPAPTPPAPTRIRQPGVPAASTPPVTPAMPVPPVAPDPPAPFPPRTVAELQALERGALPYTVVSDTVDVGRKKIVRIAYAKCASWQQVATLLKAYKEQQDSERFDTIMIQGVYPQAPSVYSFTNGQLRFDRNVRLGSLTTNRYQIETGNGYESDSLRIVLTEQ